jgi:N-acetyl sugar amidotransferase
MNELISNTYQQCNRCVMDTSASEILFDEFGNCNFCKEFLENSSQVIFEDASVKSSKLYELVERIKRSGVGKKYDCIVGVSGGVDSSMTLVEAIKLGLRPLVVHMDNGWNSELAQNNIEKLVKSLDVDLYTHVIDWEEYRKLMQSFFDADVIDVELLYDNAMLGVNYGLAKKFNIKYILSGTNLATEGMKMPEKWNWFKMDKKNIKAIAKSAGINKLKTFPSFSVFDYLYCRFIYRIEWISFLDYLDFNKFDSLNILEEKFGYKRYPYKHYESIFTRFYQGFILPNKFGVDKRKLHYSTLIVSNQISRTVALSEITGIAYPSESDLVNDKIYFLKKMDWSDEDLNNYMKRVEISHSAYSSEKGIWDFILKFNTVLKKIISFN